MVFAEFSKVTDSSKVRRLNSKFPVDVAAKLELTSFLFSSTISPQIWIDSSANKRKQTGIFRNGNAKLFLEWSKLSRFLLFSKKRCLSPSWSPKLKKFWTTYFCGTANFGKSEWFSEMRNWNHQQMVNWFVWKSLLYGCEKAIVKPFYPRHGKKQKHAWGSSRLVWEATTQALRTPKEAQVPNAKQSWSDQSKNITISDFYAEKWNSSPVIIDNWENSTHND